MIRPRSPGTALLLAAFSLAVIPAWRAATADDDDYSRVLGSVHIAAGQHAGDATTVNGHVEIDSDAVVKRAETVNGGVTMHAHSSATSVKTVNGSAELESGVRVAGGVEVVNGHISLDKYADVGGRVTNVNGPIQLTGAHVGGGVETTTGDISINGAARVEGGILVNHANSDSWFSFSKPRVPRVVIGPGAVIKGPLHFEREVQLYVSDRASIGPVDGATPIRFSGDRPPD